MNEELIPQKESFLQEVEHQLLRKNLDAKLLEDGLLHVRWNEHPLCTVGGNGTVWFRPEDIAGLEEDERLRSVTQTASQVKEYMRVFERAPTLKAVDLKDDYKLLADFGDAALAGRLSQKGARFVTWEWDSDRRGVHTGHYFMENYAAAKQDFAVRAGLVESQRLFSDEQLNAIKNACNFALEADAARSYPGEKHLRSIQEQVEALLPQHTGADRSSAAAAAGAGTALRNGADNVIFRREPGFLLRSPGLFAFLEVNDHCREIKALESAHQQICAGLLTRPAGTAEVQQS